MKCDIDKEGVMHICPETELEVYALGKWGKDFFRTEAYDPDTSPVDLSKIIVHLDLESKILSPLPKIF